jgi:PAS domain S-box-containing protein
MRELESIAKQVEVTALSIRERIARIHDALYALRDLTISLYENTPRDGTVVRDWLRRGGFGFDRHGYYERLELLERARAGEVEPGVHIYYANDAIVRDPEALFRMYALRGLPRSLDTLTRRLPGLAWLYYQDATRLVIVYPMHDPCTVVPPDFDWHAYHTYLLVKPENNPERRVLWTPPNIDYGGKGLMVAPSIPLYRDDEFFGVWSFDVPVESLIHDSVVEPVVTGQQSFIVDREGILIAHDTLATLIAPSVGDVYRKPLAELGGGFSTLDLDSLWNSGQARLTDVEGELRYAIARPIPALDWLLVATFPAQGVLQKMERSFLEAFDHAREGDLSHRVENIGIAGLQGLVDGFNEMVATVQSTLEGSEKAMRELEVSRDRARALFDASPVGLGVVDSSGNLLDINDELARLLGYSLPDEKVSALKDMVPRELNGELQQLLDDAVTLGSAGPVETELVNASGVFAPVRLLAHRLQHRAEVLVLLGVEDITERRRLQSQLLHTQKMQAIGKLAGGIAHDFNNILTVMMINLGSLRSMFCSHDSADRLMDQIDLACKRAAALTSRLLVFSRQDVIQRRPLDPARIIEESKQFLQPLLDDDVTLSVVIDGVLPSVRGDEGQLLQVVMNLVVNAGEALRGRGGCIELKLSPRPESGSITGAGIRVSDNGPGIDSGIIAHIFQPFYTTKAHGTGLGLATVHDIVTAMGGTIEVESAPGQGTVFAVTLPGIREEDASEQESPDLAVSDVDGCVVIVDDEPLVREASARALQLDGIEVRAVASAVQALAAIEELGDRMALLVTDVVMPEMGGRELAARAAELCPGLPVLYMSGYTDDTILRHGVETATVNFLRKPFTPQVLVHAVKRTLVRSAARPGMQRGAV